MHAVNKGWKKNQRETDIAALTNEIAPDSMEINLLF